MEKKRKRLLFYSLLEIAIILALMGSLVALSLDTTVLNQQYLVKKSQTGTFVIEYRNIYNDVLNYCAQSNGFSSQQIRHLTLTESQTKLLLKQTTQNFCAGRKQLANADTFTAMVEHNLESALKKGSLKATPQQLYNFHHIFAQDAALYFGIKFRRSGMMRVQQRYLIGRVVCRILMVGALVVIGLILLIFYYSNERNIAKTFKLLELALPAAGLAVVLLALVATMINSSFAYQNSVYSFNSLYFKYLVEAQNMLWMLGGGLIILGSFIAFFRSSLFQDLMEAAQYNSNGHY